MYFQKFTSSSLLGCYVRQSECSVDCAARKWFFVCVRLSEHFNTGWKKEEFPHYYLDLRL